MTGSTLPSASSTLSSARTLRISPTTRNPSIPCWISATLHSSVTGNSLTMGASTLVLLSAVSPERSNLSFTSFAETMPK